MRLKIAQDQVIDTAEMTSAALVALQDELLTRLDRDKRQRAAAREYHRQTGEYADPVWYTMLESRIKATNIAVQRLYHEIGERRRVERMAQHGPRRPRRTATSLGDCFMQVCQERMDTAEFEAYVAAARVREHELAEEQMEELENV